MPLLTPDGQRIFVPLPPQDGPFSPSGIPGQLPAPVPPPPMPPQGGPFGPSGIRGQILTPDGQRIASCLSATRGNYLACGVAEGANELSKCANGIGVPGGCLGPNGEIRKFFDNALKDGTQGPGPCNFFVNPFGNGCR
jgi:hypothetical protein